MITLQNVRKDYLVEKKSITALKKIDLTIERGEVFGIIGHSGAGKSTLIRCINLLEKPTMGSIIVDGQDLTRLSPSQLQTARREIGMIFQHFNLLSSATIYENIAFPLRLSKRSKSEIDKKVRDLLELVGLADHAKKYPAQLSGGQKQRVGIARALANDPKVLLCDEATSALDPMTTQSILKLLSDINKKLGLTIVLITHEMHVIREICDRVGVIDGGEIVELGPVAEVFLNPKQSITQEFVEQVSDFDFPEELLEQYKKMPAPERACHQVVQVSFLGDTTFQPVLFQVLQSLPVQFNILHGTINRIKDTPFGRLVLEITGEPDDARDAVKHLQERGLRVEVLL
ncbi:methionine ABC transporter ATP-binding protein [Tumebacillus flagellatus]|uniref:Methionine ABC transporter ATP-binding protein n=1 Tax=Tumebacillus flagellatus TaxID=1157490 RepID=A0A074M8F3_9BACL|nr:methionine ABC transporter ATP-binding protein [Tumebacillus flagellatus]KEO82267.1 methionine ABC transporter ATP-binding protein [Tumebacillus flagellatus]